MVRLRRKSLSETSRLRLSGAACALAKFHTLLAHASNSGSCVTPRSMVIASYFVRPGDLWLLLGSPPSRCSTISVVRLSALTLLTPATYPFGPHFTRNLKFLYGSKRIGFTLTV